VNKHAALRKDANILSRRWVLGFIFITNNPIRVDPLPAESVAITMVNGKKFKVRSPVGRLCDILEIFFGILKLYAPRFKSKNSE
jgi:hypothetical protein